QFHNKCVVGTEPKIHLELFSQHRTEGISYLWLIDLEKTYEIGFSHQFKHLNIEQNRRLIAEFGYESVLNSTIHEMLDNPRARLFEFENHWVNPSIILWRRESQDYHFSQGKQEMLENQRARIYEFQDHWVELENSDDSVTQSFLLNAQTRGMVNNPMVRLFSDENLTGDSEDYHSGQSREPDRTNTFVVNINSTTSSALSLSVATNRKVVLNFEATSALNKTN
ncbi:unnamed protein product, partial [Allacma fusca]